MELMTTSPDKFAAQFNLLVPGACRHITAEDVRLLTACGLIGKYHCYLRTDLEIVRAVLQYEQLREKKIEKSETKAISDVTYCKSCGQPVPAPPPGKKGRHREYCASCESVRVRERYRKWRMNRQSIPC